jgi:hypothetical protein
MRAVLVDRLGQHADVPDRITDLHSLPQVLGVTRL